MVEAKVVQEGVPDEKAVAELLKRCIESKAISAVFFTILQGENFDYNAAIAKDLKISTAAVDGHIKLLLEAGLIKKKEEGRNPLRYEANYDLVIALLKYIFYEAISDILDFRSFDIKNETSMAQEDAALLKQINSQKNEYLDAVARITKNELFRGIIIQYMKGIWRYMKLPSHEKMSITQSLTAIIQSSNSVFSNEIFKKKTDSQIKEKFRKDILFIAPIMAFTRPYVQEELLFALTLSLYGTGWKVKLPTKKKSLLPRNINRRIYRK